MDSMVEKVALAMAADNDSEAMFMRGDNTEGWEQLARAAISAMMEPTDHMVWKGEGMSDFILDAEYFDNSGDGRRAEMRMAYKVMIAAALEEAALSDTEGR